jgi:hypothetical protein
MTELSNEIPHDQGSSVLGDVEYERTKNDHPGGSKTDLIGQILRKFEEAGEAMRYLATNGEIAWKATPGMLGRLADAEQEARDDEWAEWY